MAEAALTQTLANHILTEVMSAAETAGTVCGAGGVILAATVAERVGKVHDGAARILRGECDEVAITAEDAARMTGARPGYNCVIIHHGWRVGTIGMTGDPTEVKRAVRVAVKVAQMLLETQVQKERMRGEALQGLQNVSAAAQQVLAGTTEHVRLAAHLEATAGKLLEQSRVASSALRVISDLAQRANLLGLNAAVEAAHAGSQGAGFTVVASEIRKLADRTRLSADQVQKALGEWQTTFDGMSVQVQATSRTTREQEMALRSVTGQIQRVEQIMTGLTS